jgi:hypothetical protein
MTRENKPRPKGRPPKPEADRKRTNFTMRVRDELRDQLRAAAAASGRSVSEEIEHRLERSFSEDQAFQWALGGEHNERFMRAFTIAAWLIETRTGKKWHEDDETMHEVRFAASAIIAAIRRKLTPHEADSLLTQSSYAEYAFGVPVNPSMYHAATAALSTLHTMGLAPSADEVAAHMQEELAKGRKRARQEAHARARGIFPMPAGLLGGGIYPPEVYEVEPPDNDDTSPFNAAGLAGDQLAAPSPQAHEGQPTRDAPSRRGRRQGS